MRLAPVLLALLLPLSGLVTPQLVHAQTVSRPSSQILVIDMERVFRVSVAGSRLTSSLEAKLAELAAENRRIEAELVAEEKDLTDKRARMDPEAFRKLADAFDAKVQKVRAEQDAKQEELQRQRDADRQAFIESIGPILSQIGRERGALVILDRRTVLLSADSIDITDEAIARIDALTAQPQDGSGQGGTGNSDGSGSAGAAPGSGN